MGAREIAPSCKIDKGHASAPARDSSRGSGQERETDRERAREETQICRRPPDVMEKVDCGSLHLLTRRIFT